MPPRHQLISAKHLVGRLRFLPDEIFQARKVAIEEGHKLALLKSRVADLESELLTQEGSPINGKNEQIREAQLHELMKQWDIPLADQERSANLSEAMHDRLVYEFESLRLITGYMALCGARSEEGDIE